jgi:hypothetical protein
MEATSAGEIVLRIWGTGRHNAVRYESLLLADAVQIR